MDLKYSFTYNIFYLKSGHFVGDNLRAQNLPEGRENNFLIKSLKPKMQSSNSGRKEEENGHTQDGYENQYPGLGIKQFQKIPSGGNFSWISGEPIIRNILKSWSTDCYFSS